MKPDDVILLFDRRPFVPMDIRTSGGRVYRIDHPEFAMRSRDGNTIFLQTDDDRHIRIDSHHLVAVEAVNSPAAA